MSESVATYIVAVSGGIDSSVLLDMLVSHGPMLKYHFPENTRFVVAHVNHGIRAESAVRDKDFVESLAKKYNLEFESIDLHLGPDASEAKARAGRYEFLESLQKKYRASGIILAHHSDDVIETAIINHIRGTGRRGFTSLSSSNDRVRPILHLSKDDIRIYASKRALKWVEDETNFDDKYLRNKIRSKLQDQSKTDTKQLFATKLQELKQKNDLLDSEIANLLQYKVKDKALLSRSWFAKLPHDLASEIMYAMLSSLGTSDINRQLVERLTISLKVARPGTMLDIDKNIVGLITKRSLRFINRETLKTL